MKKLSLLLAALMVLCCFALASCGGDEETSSTASSTAAVSSAASSEAEASSEEVSSEEASSEEASSEESVAEGPVVGEAKTLFLTHFEDGASEGAGSMFFTTDTAGAWWTHVAFKPVEVEGLENVYEIAEISVGVGSGAGTVLTIPEGGFVYAINVGNNWPELVAGDPDAYPGQVNEPDYTSPNCNNMISDVNTWAVGDKILFAGVDFENKTVPTSTADTPWYDDAYVSTATWAFVTE